MKKLMALVLVTCFMFTLVGQAGAIYTPPCNVKPTKEDLAVATAFFNGIKFDASQARNNIIKITIPKLNEKYVFTLSHRTMKANYQVIGNYDLSLKRGEIKTVNNILPGYITGFSLYMGNCDTGASLLQELWTYTTGDSRVKYIPFQDRKYPHIENGQIIYWINDIGERINEDGTPYDPDASNKANGLTFRDVPINHWAGPVIKKLAEAGYIKGYPDKTFQPEGNITRAEYMVMLANILKAKWPDGSKNDHSSQNSILPSQHWSNDTVMLIFKYMPSNSIKQIFQSDFQPDKRINRDEVVAVLMSVLTSHPNFGADSGSPQNFIDQSFSSFAQAINFAANQGLVSGYPDGTFKPSGNITRAEIAAVMTKVLVKL